MAAYITASVKRSQFIPLHRDLKEKEKLGSANNSDDGVVFSAAACRRRNGPAPINGRIYPKLSADSVFISAQRCLFWYLFGVGFWRASARLNGTSKT